MQTVKKIVKEKFFVCHPHICMRRWHTHTVPVPLFKKRIYSLLPMFHLVVWVQWCYSSAPLFYRFHSLQILALRPPTFFSDYLGFLPINPCIAYRAVFRQSTVVVVHSFVGSIHIPSCYLRHVVWDGLCLCAPSRATPIFDQSLHYKSSFHIYKEFCKRSCCSSSRVEFLLSR